MRWVSDLDIRVAVKDFGHRVAVLIDVFTSHRSFGVYEPRFCSNLLSLYQTMKSDGAFYCVVVKFRFGVW